VVAVVNQVSSAALQRVGDRSTKGDPSSFAGKTIPVVTVHPSISQSYAFFLLGCGQSVIQTMALIVINRVEYNSHLKSIDPAQIHLLYWYRL
jgi:hypothetical protein